MNKKILITSIAALLVVSASGLFLGRVLKMSQASKTASENLIPTIEPVEYETWKDQSEFEFQYPKNLKFDPHPEDNENYAHLELTSNSFPGSIILWTKDNTYQTVDDYLKGKNITQSIGSSLGEYPAVKILDQSDVNKFSLITIRKGYLYQIEVDSKGEKIWNDIFNQIADSYKFIEPEAPENTTVNSAPQAPASSEEIYTEEEIIE